MGDSVRNSSRYQKALYLMMITTAWALGGWAESICQGQQEKHNYLYICIYIYIYIHIIIIIISFVYSDKEKQREREEEGPIHLHDF